MHIFAAVIAAVFTAPAFGCPTLAGNYQCSTRDGASETVTVTQTTDQNGTVTYLYNGSQIEADGKVYDVPGDDSLREGKFRAWCDDNLTLKTELTGKYWSQGSFYGDLTMDVNFSRVNNQLRSQTTGQLASGNGGAPFDTTIECTQL